MTLEVKDCRWPWNRLYLHADGNIKPCCYATRPLGNVLAGDDPAEVWNGPAMADLRQAITENRLHPVCAGAGCSFVRSRLPEGADRAALAVFADVPTGLVDRATAERAALGHANAVFAIACALLEQARRESTPRAMAAACRWLRRSDRLGSAMATYNLALILEGRPRLASARLAARLARRAADRGYMPAHIVLGQMRLSGRGLDQSVVAAAEHFQAAAEAGEVDGYYMQGLVLSSVPARLEEARHALKVAAARGHAAAGQHLRQLAAPRPTPRAGAAAGPSDNRAQRTPG
ncbi:MAG: SPASM domain-containing protein [Hyphomicrobiaceae bacterium]